MNRSSHVLLALVAGALMSSPQNAAGDFVPLVGDAYSNTPNSGTKKALVVDGAGGTKTFLQFDLSTLPGGTLPVGTNAYHVTKATLILGVGKVTNAGAFDVVRVTSAWNEAATTVNPSTGAAEVSAVPLAVADKNTFKAVDVTPVVRDWLNGVLPNNGLALVPNGNAVAAVFDSKENTTTSHFAQLDIVLTGEAGANTTLGSGAMRFAAGNAGNSTALGSLALQNAAGTNNTAVGTTALSGTSVGYFNTAVGSGALEGNTGSGNTAVGYAANAIVGAGSSNTAIGEEALLHNSSSDNTAVGVLALFNNTSGTGNIALGMSAGSSLTTGSNNIDIGHAGVAGESSTIRIGDPGLQTSTFIAGISGAVGNGSGVAVYVDATGKLSPTVSSIRFKDDVRDMGETTDALLKLRPVLFHYKKDIDPAGLQQYGLVAEEVAKVYPGLVVYDEQGHPQTVRYHFVNAMMLNELQKQARQVAAQRRQLTEQARQMKDQAEQLEMLRARLVQIEAAVGVQSGSPALKASYAPGSDL